MSGQPNPPLWHAWRPPHLYTFRPARNIHTVSNNSNIPPYGANFAIPPPLNDLESFPPLTSPPRALPITPSPVEGPIAISDSIPAVPFQNSINAPFSLFGRPSRSSSDFGTSLTFAPNGDDADLHNTYYVQNLPRRSSSTFRPPHPRHPPPLQVSPPAESQFNLPYERNHFPPLLPLWQYHLPRPPPQTLNNNFQPFIPQFPIDYQHQLSHGPHLDSEQTHPISSHTQMQSPPVPILQNGFIDQDTPTLTENTELNLDASITIFLRNLQILRRIDSILVGGKGKPQYFHPSREHQLFGPIHLANSAAPLLLSKNKSPLEKQLILEDMHNWLMIHSTTLADAAATLGLSCHDPSTDDRMDFGIVNLLEIDSNAILEKALVIRILGMAEVTIRDVAILPTVGLFEVVDGSWRQARIGLNSPVTITIRANTGYWSEGAGLMEATVIFVLDIYPVDSTSTSSNLPWKLLLPQVIKLTFTDRAPGDSGLSALAPKFVPAWLRHLAIYPVPESEVIDAPPPPRVNPREWLIKNHEENDRLTLRKIDSLVGVPSLRPIPPPKQSNESVDTGSQGENALPLTTETYALHFSLLLRLELGYVISKYHSYTLYNLPLIRHRTQDTPDDMNIFLLKVPGVADDAPSLVRGDEVRIRKIPASDTLAVGEWRGWVYHVERRKGEVLVMLGQEVKVVEEDRFVVKFVVGREQWGNMLKGLEEVEWEENEGKNDIAKFEMRGLRSFLFPELTDCTIIPPEEDLGLPQHTLKFSDPDLNWEQQAAVERVTKGDYGSVPFVVHGPPGTGKTKTLTECVLQILARHPDARIIISAPSNSACDTVTRRLLGKLGTSEMIRLNHPSRTFAEVPAELMPFCFIDGGAFAVPTLREFLTRKVIVVTCLTAGLLCSLGLSNTDLRDLLKNDETRSKPSQPFHWTHLLIDEAGQATEPEVLLPLSLLVDSTPELTRRAQFVLCGDHRQLGPMIMSPQARKHGLHISLLERLTATTLTMYQPSGRWDRSDVRWVVAAPSTKKMTVARPVRLRPCCVSLARNYRSHMAMLLVPSALFYNDTLEPFADRRATTAILNRSWSGLPNTGIPMVFYNCAGQNDVLAEVLEGDGRAGWWNLAEAREVVRIVRSLVEEGAAEKRDLGVITPFREQVKRIRAMLRKCGFSQVNVGTVEDYQGQERSVIIISCVRARSGEVLREDEHAGIGLIGFPKRFNVAVTRARALVCVVGNAEVLVAQDFSWREWIGFLGKNKCILAAGGDAVGDKEEWVAMLERMERKVGRLERGKRFSDWVGGLEKEKWLGRGREVNSMGEMLIAEPYEEEEESKEGNDDEEEEDNKKEESEKIPPS